MMGWGRQVAGMTVVAVLLAGCASQPPKQETTPPPAPEPEVVKEMVTVTVTSENLRAAPNGSKVGEALSGQSFEQLERRGNWVQISHPEQGGVWIWGPSLGLDTVNPASVPLWLGGNQPQTVDEITAVFGSPIEVSAVGGDVFWYGYDNVLPGGGSRFGTDRFRHVRVLLDRKSRATLQLEMELGPFVGSVKDLLPAVGLPAKKSSTSNFDRALFMKSFPGLEEVEVRYRKGDFNTIEHLHARRYAEDSFASDLSAGTKKLVPDAGALFLSMDVTNLGGMAYAAPTIELELFLDESSVGTYAVGPLDARIEPAATTSLMGELPISADRYDLNRLGARAEIVSAIAVPASGASQP